MNPSTSDSRLCQLYAVQGNHRSLTWRVHQSLTCNHIIQSGNYLLLRFFLRRPKSWNKHHSWGEADTKLWGIQNLEEGSRLALEEIYPQTKVKWFPSATEVQEKKKPPTSAFRRRASPDPIGGNIHITSLTFFKLIYFLLKDYCFTEFAVFCKTSAWISHRYTCIPSLLKLPSISLPIPPL